MKILKLLSWVGFAAMSVVLYFGFTTGDFFKEGSMLLSNPWGIVSMVDLYTGFMLFSFWIVYREDSVWRSIIWVIAMMVLGFWAGSVYTLLALYRSDNDWRRFWLGSKA